MQTASLGTHAEDVPTWPAESYEERNGVEKSCRMISQPERGEQVLVVRLTATNRGTILSKCTTAWETTWT